MRFIGNKKNLVETIYLELSSRGIKGDFFCDLFSGTASVGKFFKEKGYKVLSSDIMYFSYVLQRAYIQNDSSIKFKKLLDTLEIIPKNLFFDSFDIILEYLENIPLSEGFIYKNYSMEGTINLDKPRKFFSAYNAKKIDAIRSTIEIWKKEMLINEDEYFILIACLIESVSFYANVSGVYAAFHKKWDPRALKKLKLRKIKLLQNHKANISHHGNSLELINHIDVDILYLDPPYNHRQYAPNYHLLETIARYDEPKIKGVAGLRDYSFQKSNFCNQKKALEELELIALKASYQYLILSYNCEGVMPQESILKTLKKYGKVELIEFDYRRYKSNSNGTNTTKKKIKEQLYILTRV